MLVYLGGALVVTVSDKLGKAWHPHFKEGGAQLESLKITKEKFVMMQKTNLMLSGTRFVFEVSKGPAHVHYSFLSNAVYINRMHEINRTFFGTARSPLNTSSLARIEEA